MDQRRILIGAPCAVIVGTCHSNPRREQPARGPTQKAILDTKRVPERRLDFGRRRPKAESLRAGLFELSRHFDPPARTLVWNAESPIIDVFRMHHEASTFDAISAGGTRVFLGELRDDAPDDMRRLRFDPAIHLVARRLRPPAG